MPGAVLDSWKAIATYLNRGVRTVRRWEKEEGLPVHRHMHRRLGSVYAYPHELDAWRAGRSRSAARSVVDKDAYYAYLKGRHFLNQFNPESVRRSVDYFHQALRIDPSFARAHAALAEACEQLPMWLETPPGNTIPMALAAAEEALRLDPGLAEAHASLGLIHANYLRAWPQADEHFRRALSLNPGLSQARMWYSEFLAEMGRTDEALSVIEPAQAADPLSCAIHATRAFALTMGRRFPEAVTEADRALEIDPGYPMALIRKGLASVFHGALDQGIASLERVTKASPGLLVGQALLGYASGRAGRSADARAQLELLERAATERYVPDFLCALPLIGLGEHDAAVAKLENEFTARGWYLVLLKQAPQFDPLRSAPKFQALMARMNFPDP